MEWIERRAGLIGIGAIVVAAVALGVALASGSHDDRRGWFAPLIYRDDINSAPAPFEGGPLTRGFEAGPGQIPAGGGPTFRRFEMRPGQPLPIPGLATGGVLHGELTLPAPNGKYQTVDVQRGTVTSVSSTALTVRSSDGFTKTYAITKSLAQGVAKGDQVQLRATVSKGKATVTSLRAVRRSMR